MTSPYLQKPRRELDEVVHGHAAPCPEKDSSEIREQIDALKSWDFFAGSEWYILCVSALVVGAVLAAALTLPDPEIAQYMNEEPSAEGIYDIAPAAGPPATESYVNGSQLNHSVKYGSDPFDQVLPESQTLTPME